MGWRWSCLRSGRLYWLLRLPSLLVQDSWLDFVDGRLVAAAGLPHVDPLTLWTLGKSWTDQQWGAQVVLYELVHHGGFAARARRGDRVRDRGAGDPRDRCAPARWLTARHGDRAVPARCSPRRALAQLRAQTFALVLFAAVFALLALDARSPSRRVLWVLPLLVVWANLHGSVALGAASRLRLWPDARAVRVTRARGLVLAVASPFCLLASPYGWHLAGYYHLMLLDPPLEHYVQEWKPPELIGSNVVFFASAVAVAGLWIWRRRSLTRFEQWALPLLELAPSAPCGMRCGSSWRRWWRCRDCSTAGKSCVEASVRRANLILGSAAVAVAVAVAAFALGGATGRVDDRRPPAEAAAVAAAAGTTVSCSPTTTTPIGCCGCSRPLPDGSPTTSGSSCSTVGSYATSSCCTAGLRRSGGGAASRRVSSPSGAAATTRLPRAFSRAARTRSSTRRRSSRWLSRPPLAKLR